MKEFYSVDKAMSIMENKGLGMFPRAYDGHYRQFNKFASSLHIKSKKREYALCCTDIDFSNIVRNCKTKNYRYILINSATSETIKYIQNIIRENEPDIIICIKNGNQILYSSSAEKYIPHMIKFFTNENFNFVTDVLCENNINMHTSK